MNKLIVVNGQILNGVIYFRPENGKTIQSPLSPMPFGVHQSLPNMEKRDENDIVNIAGSLGWEVLQISYPRIGYTAICRERN